MTTSNIAARVEGRYRRTAARLLSRRPFAVNPEAPIVSFTFDDFPRSALLTGGAILKRFGIVGTYYASFGLMGQTAPTGPIFVPEDVRMLMDHGHELGCHTFAHCHAWESNPTTFERSVIENRQTLRTSFPGTSFKTFSYPIGPPRPQIKRRAARYFACCRGGGQTFNVGTMDLNNLAAYFIEKSRNRLEAIKDLVEENRRARGWLIFATHDVCHDPTAFGCTPEQFEMVVRFAVDSGARILPVAQALDALRIPAEARLS